MSRIHGTRRKREDTRESEIEYRRTLGETRGHGRTRRHAGSGRPSRRYLPTRGRPKYDKVSLRSTGNNQGTVVVDRAMSLDVVSYSRTRTELNSPVATSRVQIDEVELRQAVINLPGECLPAERIDLNQRFVALRPRWCFDLHCPDWGGRALGSQAPQSSFDKLRRASDRR